MKVNILGVKIDKVNMAEALEIVQVWLNKNQGQNKRTSKKYIVTPNLEFLILTQKDPEFKQTLNKADLSLPDSSHLSWFTKEKMPTTTGIDFMLELIEICQKKGYSIGLLGGRQGVAEKASEVLKQKYPNLKISFKEEGGLVGNRGDIARANEMSGDLQTNNSFQYCLQGLSFQRVGSRSNYNFPYSDILFVAFGHGKQEKWIAKNMNKINARVFMGVGGAFDYISGLIPRAPVWIRKIGLEWLFRLIVQPRRIKRQFEIVKFIVRVLMRKT